jgi:pilus assembly protein Flp/PilA
MAKFATAIRSVVKGEEGATMVEYALMVALIAVACIGAVTALGGGVQASFSNIVNSL